MNTILNSTCLISCILYSVSVFSSDYPAEFEDFFSENSQKIHVKIVGEDEGEDVLALVKYDSFKIAYETEGYFTFEDFLKEKGLKKEFIDKALRDSVNGIKNDPYCSVNFRTCLLEPNNEDIRYVFDFENSLLRIFLPSNSLRQDLEELEFASPINKNTAIINWGSFYAYSDFDNLDYITLTNNTTIGLPLGSLFLDTTYSSRDHDVEFYSAIYDVEVNDKRIQAGKNRYNLSFNSTDYINNGSKYSGESIYLSSSRNLLKGDWDSQQKVFFYSPQTAQLEVYRDGRLIFNKVVGEGRQSLNYAELPKGVYEATLILKSSGNVILSNVLQIVNNNKFSLQKNQFDYVLGGGVFQDTNLGGISSYKDFDKKYLRGMLNYRIYEDVLLGGGVTFGNEEFLYSLAGVWAFSEKGTLEYVGSISNSGDYFQTARITHSPFFADYQSFTLNDKVFSYGLAQQVYGQSGYENFGFGVSGNILSGNGYLRFSSSEYENERNFNGYKNSEVKSISAGWSMFLPKGQINITTELTDSNNFEREIKTSLSYTLKLSDLFSTQFSVYGDKTQFNSNRNYIRYNNSYGNWRNDTSIGTRIDRGYEISGDISSSLNGSTSGANVGLYGYLNDSGVKNLSANISGTQILSRDGFSFSHEKGKSFVKIRTINQELSPDKKIDVTIEKNGKFKNRMKISREDTIIKMNEYTDNSLHLESSTGNILIENDKLRLYTLPGSLHSFDARIFNTISKIIVLDDVNKEPIKNVQCIGEACINIEPLTDDGVFRVNLVPGKSYQLVSNKGICIIEVKNAELYDKGYCLPGLDKPLDSILEFKSETEKSIDSSSLVYLGAFNSGESSDQLKEMMKANKINYRYIDISGISFFYLSKEQVFNGVSFGFLKELDVYVFRNSLLFNSVNLTMN